MIKKTIIKEITFFYYNGEIKSNTIDELIEFLNRSPKSKNGIFSDGSSIMISNIKIDMLNNKPHSLSIGLNLGGSVMDIKIKPDKYYFFQGGEIKSVDDPEDDTFW